MITSPASCCSLYVESFLDTNAGCLPNGFSTGFLYAGPNASRWLVTNWHVVTGRRADAPTELIGERTSSPSRLRFHVQNPYGNERQHLEIPLYREGRPSWIEADRESGVDLALIQLTDRPQFPFPFAQNFAPDFRGDVAPGADVVIIGHPFRLGRYAPSAIWKSAMVATEGSAVDDHRPWVLVDAPGMPGMSGSPVYRRTGEMSAAGGPELELFGIYAGASGDPRLEALRLGRVHPIHLLGDIICRREPGRNPHPPLHD